MDSITGIEVGCHRPVAASPAFNLTLTLAISYRQTLGNIRSWTDKLYMTTSPRSMPNT